MYVSEVKGMFKSREKKNEREYFVSYFYYDAMGIKHCNCTMLILSKPVSDFGRELDLLAESLKFTHKTDEIYFISVSRV